MSTILPRAGGKARMLLAPTLARLDLSGRTRVVEPFAGGAIETIGGSGNGTREILIRGEERSVIGREVAA